MYLLPLLDPKYLTGCGIPECSPKSHLRSGYWQMPVRSRGTFPSTTFETPLGHYTLNFSVYALVPLWLWFRTLRILYCTLLHSHNMPITICLNLRRFTPVPCLVWAGTSVLLFFGGMQFSHRPLQLLEISHKLNSSIAMAFD